MNVGTIGGIEASLKPTPARWSKPDRQEQAHYGDDPAQVGRGPEWQARIKAAEEYARFEPEA
jgi:hypothetical protein